MKLNNKWLFLAAFFVLALPLVFSGNASAVTATTGTYNTDAATQNVSGGWSLPSNFYCIGTPSGWTPSGTGDLLAGGANDATHRTDLDCTDTTNPVCGTCAITGAAANAVKFTDYPTDTVKRGIDDCVAHGYAWSGYSQSCGAANWTTNDPDSSPLPYYTDHKGCLRCHNDAYINAPGGRHAGDNWAVKESYLMTGHKNMVRKVTPTQGPDAGTVFTMLGPDGQPYAGYDWTTGTDLTTGLRVYWVADGWFENTGAPRATESGGSYTCGRCHATGWTADASTITGKEPYESFGDLTGIVGLQDKVFTGTTTSSWDRWGIECSRCHQATGGPTGSEPGTYSGGHTTFPESTSTGGDVTAMCANCHRQENGDVPEGYSDATFSSKYPEADVFQPAGIRVHYGLSHGSVASDSHGPVYQFLNSPHAEFTGTFGDIGCPPTSIVPAAGYACDSSMSKYASDFTIDPKSNESPLGKALGGGCTGCHDVHNSVDEVTGQADKATKSCQYCHSNSTDTYAPQIALSAIRHPNAPGTPLDTTMYRSACVVCHMPGGDHYFRINTDPTYQTVTVPADTTGWTGAYANTAADGDYQNAIWNDLDHTCGQCHGGSAGASATKNGAPYMDVQTLSSLAQGIHGSGSGSTGARFNWTKGSDCNAVNLDGSINGSGTTCTWSVTDGGSFTSGSASDCIATFKFDASGSHAVTLTTDAGSRTMIVTASTNNAVPSTGMSVATDVTDTTGMTVTLTDSSTANSCGASSTTGTGIILWGDGTTDVVATTVGTTSTPHKYNVKGTYTIRYAFRDSNNNKAMSSPVTITVPSSDVPGAGLFTVSGTITYDINTPCYDLNNDGNCTDPGEVGPGDGVQNAQILVKTSGGTIVKMGKTDSTGNYSISGVQGGQTYTVVVIKNGLTFTAIPDDQVDITTPTADFIGTFQ